MIRSLYHHILLPNTSRPVNRLLKKYKYIQPNDKSRAGIPK